MNMKNILRLMGFWGAPCLNKQRRGGVVLLGWYSDEKTSTFNKVLVFDKLGVYFISNDSTNIIKEHLFKEK